MKKRKECQRKTLKVKKKTKTEFIMIMAITFKVKIRNKKMIVERRVVYINCSEEIESAIKYYRVL